MILFLWGALAMASVVVGLMFLKFWRRTGELLFGFFGTAFFVFALNWFILGIVQPSDESRHYAYVVRLLAFALIILGILAKNRG